MRVDLSTLKLIAEVDFADIVQAASIMRGKLRVVLVDGSYIDFWWSRSLRGRFAHHWERTHVDGKIYRHDNAPHAKWRKVTTFPQHFHSGDDLTVVESYLSPIPEAAVREFLTFARDILRNITNYVR
jgi:hypothetical protein